MKAVSHFRTTDAAAALAAANKRVSNILAKSDEVLSDRVNASTLKEPEEIKLAMQVVVLRDKLEPYFTEGRYGMRWSNWLSCVNRLMLSSIK